jgi:serine/threonine protein kinase
MDATSPRWQQVTPSQHSWEEDALGTLRTMLPDSDPFRVWTNFEFTDGGRIHEADALVITPKGVFLIEIKSWSGRVKGDQGTWVQERRDGSRLAVNNPARLNTSKVRSLASLIKRNWRGGPTAPRTPFIESLVWFSNPNLRVALPVELYNQVAVADDNKAASNHIQTLSQAIIDIGETESTRSGFRRISAEQSDEFATTMDRIGLKESTRTRTAGSYELQLPAFAERGSTQDFNAKHKLHRLPARVRIYSNVANATPEDAKALRDAATREYMATQNLRLDGVVGAIDMDLTDFGPAVIFEQPADALRLDKFLAERGEDLDTDARLRIIEQIATTVRAMHRRRISHRMLTPESVWLRPSTSTRDGATTGTVWEPLISDFSLAARESADGPGTVTTYTRVGSLPVARTGAVEVVLADPAMETYLAPEAFTDAGADGVSLDAFSVGALTHLLFADQAPARDRSEVRAALGNAGLSVSAVKPEIDPRIEELVRNCTNPIVSDRTTSMAEILDRIALARGEDYGAVEEQAEADPLTAEPGDVLGDRFEVKQRLGKGSTAVALWCADCAHDRDVVLKIASKEANNARLVFEGEALDNLRQQNVVELYEQLPMAGRQVLVLSFAGEESLTGYLRLEGAVSTDFLRRWGEDLLEAVRYLEKVGVSHRDVKPDNLGIIEMGPRKQSHLVLFDFSLAGTSAEDTKAGTPGYLDPFLDDEGRKRYDLAAERYAAAITIHEMATGETPTWGDGRTDPAYLAEDVQPELLVEGIDPEIRAPMVEFLTRALQRDPAKRFDTADDMARAWLAVFADWEHSAESADDDEPEADGKPAAGKALPDNLSLDDPIASLPTSRKVRSALRKVGAETVRQVATLDAVKVNKTRGVAVKTRKQALKLRAAVLERFAEDLATESAQTSPTMPTSAEQADPAASTATDPSDGEQGRQGRDDDIDVASVETPVPDLDELGTMLVPPRAKRGRAGSVEETVRHLLGLSPSGVAVPDDPAVEVGPEEADWPTLASTAKRVGLTAGGASHTFGKARAHWAASPDLMGVGADLLAILADLGGVAGVSELEAPLAEVRGSGNDPDEAQRLAAAVVRAVLESESPLAQLFTLRRTGRRTLVAVDGAAVNEALLHAAESDPSDAAALALSTLDRSVRHQLTGVDTAGLIDLAVKVGDRADELVESSPLVPSGDAIPALRSVAPGVGRSLSDARLVRLAGAASDDATTNATSDLVRRNASPAEALRWTRAALVSANQLTVDEIAARVAARFPGVALPERPELDEVLQQADLKLGWSEEHRAFRSTADAPGGVGPLTTSATRRPTVIGAGGTTVEPKPEAVDPAVTRAIDIDARLERSLDEGGFLALRVPTDRLAQAQRGLLRFENPARQGGQATMTSIDLEATFLRNLRAAAQERGVAWANLEGADDPSDTNWTRLSILAAAAVDAAIAEVVEHSQVIAWYPGVLVRHGSASQTAPLDRLRDAVLGGDHPIRTLWLVVLGGTTDALPKVDGTPVPALASSQWMDLSDTWLENTHRAGGLSA